MRGPEYAAAQVADYLIGRVPVKLTQLAERLGVDVLWAPNLIVGHDVPTLGLEQWPAVLILPQRTTGMTLLAAAEGGGQAWRVTYQLEALAWVRGEDTVAVEALKHRYALAVRECLLEHTMLPGGDLSIDPASLVESYSPTDSDPNGGVVAGASCGFTVTVDENLADPVPGHGQTQAVNVYSEALVLDTDAVPQHPAL